MEARHVEIERFAKKAEGYRASLEASPDARLLELSAIGAILRGYCLRQGISPEHLRVVDLMAGSGYLADFLVEMGFKTVTAIEACAEMNPRTATSMQDVTQRVAIGSLAELDQVLADMRPHVITSLAAFHHLIEYEGRKPDRVRSVVWQQSVIRTCLARLERHGILLIVDLVELDVSQNTLSPTISLWDPSVFQSREFTWPGLSDALCRSESLTEFNSAVSSVIPLQKVNPTLRWFREVVEPETEIGHDDVALCRGLLELLSGEFDLQFSPVVCPWLFRSEEEMLFYLEHKFGFLVNRKPQEIDRRKILQSASETAGVLHGSEGEAAFGWNLGAVLIHAQQDRNDPEAPIREANWWLAGLALLLATRALFGWLGASIYIAFKDHIFEVAYLLAGGAIAGLARWVSEARHAK